MNSIPKSAELRAMAQFLNIDFSTVNFRSSTQRKALYERIQQAKASVVPVEPNEELAALREENARLKAELAKYKNESPQPKKSKVRFTSGLEEKPESDNVIAFDYVEQLIKRVEKEQEETYELLRKHGRTPRVSSNDDRRVVEFRRKTTTDDKPIA